MTRKYVRLHPAEPPSPRSHHKKRRKPIDPLRREEWSPEEPWICGPWCERCVYSRKMSIGPVCDYLMITGHLRPEESTRECTVRKVPQARRRTMTMGGMTLGPAGDDFLTYRNIGNVIMKNAGTVANWSSELGGIGRMIDGYKGKQLTVDEAVTLLSGRRILVVQSAEGLTGAQAELRERLIQGGAEVFEE